MNDDAFRELVRMMRDLQREYFATGDRKVLARSKAVEKAVDRVLDGRPQPEQQGSLFDATV